MEAVHLEVGGGVLVKRVEIPVWAGMPIWPELCHLRDVEELEATPGHGQLLHKYKARK
jgi:hypothetical protein